MGDIKVQRGTTDIGNSGGTDTSFTAVSALTAAFEMNSNSQKSHQGSTSSTGNMEADDMGGRIELTGTGTLTFSRIATSLAQDMRFSWELWEYTGSGGGVNEFIVRSRNTITMSTAADGTASLDTTPTNIDNCIPFITGVTSTVTTNGEDHLTCTAYINDSGTLVVSRGGGDGSGTTVVQVVTVEFTGSNWSVYHGRVTGQTGDTGNITCTTDSDGAGGTNMNITDWSTALIHGNNRVTNNAEGLAHQAVIYRNGTASQVAWEFNTDHNATNDHVVHVLQHDDLAVTRYTANDSGPLTTNFDVTSAGLTDLEESSLWQGGATTNGTGDALGRGWRNQQLTGLTTATSTCHRTGNTMEHEIQVADLTSITSSADVTATPPAGSLSITGQAPEAIEGISIEMRPGGMHMGNVGLQFRGITPTLSIEEFARTIAVPVGALDLSGLQPNLQEQIVLGVPSGELSFTGWAPTLQEQIVLAVPPGSLTVEGWAPSAEEDHIRQVPVGALTIDPLQPSLSLAERLEVPAGELTLTGLQPEKKEDHVTDDLPAGALSFTGYVPTSVSGDSKFAQTLKGELTLTGLQPIAGEDHVSETERGEISLTGLQPSAEEDHIRQVPAGSLSLTGELPVAISGDSKVIQIPAATLSLLGYQPISSVSDVGEVVTEDSVGGWLYDFRRMQARKDDAERRRKAAIQAVKELDGVDRDIGLLLQQEEQEAEKEQFARELGRIVERSLTRRKLEQSGLMTERVEKAYDRAVIQANYSAMRALDRELQRAIEDEEFLFLVMSIR